MGGSIRPARGSPRWAKEATGDVSMSWIRSCLNGSLRGNSRVRSMLAAARDGSVACSERGTYRLLELIQPRRCSRRQANAIQAATTGAQERRLYHSLMQTSISSISYLTLIDIADFRAALREMARVLKPGGILLIANLNSFIASYQPSKRLTHYGPVASANGG